MRQGGSCTSDHADAVGACTSAADPRLPEGLCRVWRRLQRLHREPDLVRGSLCARSPSSLSDDAAALSCFASAVRRESFSDSLRTRGRGRGIALARAWGSMHEQTWMRQSWPCWKPSDILQVRAAAECFPCDPSRGRWGGVRPRRGARRLAAQHRSGLLERARTGPGRREATPVCTAQPRA